MSAKRPRPAIPVLVHVDNPTEAASFTVDTSTIEGKMDTVITNQNRIYDKIPTSSGESSADLTTVNEKITSLATAIGPANSTSTDDNIFGHVRNLNYAVGDVTKIPTTTDTSVRGLLTAIKQNTASDVDLTTVNEKITALAEATGTTNSTNINGDIIGRIKNLVLAVGDFNDTLPYNGLSVRSFLANIRNSIGALNTSISLNDTSVRAILYNIRTAVGSAAATPTLTGTSVRDLLTQIKENTASGGGGGSADLTTVNEKTTALAAAIGSASDDSSTVSVIGLLKSITDKY